MTTAISRALPLTIATAFLMEGLDCSVITTVLPAIARDLATSTPSLAVTVTAYLISLAVSMPLGGWLASRFGARPVFVAALAVFAVGSLICGLASVRAVLIAGRVVQGVGGAMMSPVGRAILISSVPKSEYMIDSLDPAAPVLVRHWVGERGVTGIRMTEAVKGSDTTWVSGPIAQDVWAVADELRVSISFHFMPWNRAACLTALGDMCDRFPQTAVVVDHFSNLVGAKNGPDFGVDSLMDDLARFPRVIQKFTMINITKMNQQGVPCAPVVKRVAQSYGANRIMWGSDVAQSKGSYADMVRLGLEATSLLAEEERQQVHYRTARSVYAW